MSKENIAKDIASAVHFEEELQLSWKEGGICVADIYSECWGYCKAVAATFRRLYFEADEAMRLKFLTVDATACLHELDNVHDDDLPRREFQRPKNVDHVRDTLPETWRPYLEQQQGHAKPLFLFFKEGRLITHISGCNTPDICAQIKDLTTVKTPADEYITNPQLLEVWSEHFGASDSEVSFERFMKAMNILCKLTVPLLDEELTSVRTALKVTKDQIVTAEELQRWVGEGTVLQAFTALIPTYEDRAIQVRLDKEAAERERVAAEAAKAAAEQAAAEESAKEGAGGEGTPEGDGTAAPATEGDAPQEQPPPAEATLEQKPAEEQ